MAAKRVVSFHDLAASLDDLDNFDAIDESLLVDDDEYAPKRDFAIEDLVPPLEDSDYLGVPDDSLVFDDDDEAEYGNTTPDINMIMTDVYQPGFLDDSINERVNFYDAMRPNANDARQISLVEAFDMRVSGEEAKIEKRLNKSAELPFDPKTAESIRDEAIEAAITAIDINSSIRDGQTDLYRAIDALAKAEVMNNIELATSPKISVGQDESRPESEAENSPPEPVAEDQQSTLYDIDETMQTSFIPSTEYYKPLEILTYVGITKSRV